MKTSLQPLKIAIYADGAKIEDMLKRYREGVVKGFTTNPSLMVKAGVKDYAAHARAILAEIRDLPISFEVFSDEFAEMERQALIIKSWGSNVNVKIPITNTKGESALPLIRRLLDQGMKLNVTALFTEEQIEDLKRILKPQDDVIVSIFAGRIGDTGVDPMPLMKWTVNAYRELKGCKILWASTREALNISQADDCGCHIITAPDDVIAKLAMRGKAPADMSLDTVKTFFADSTKAGFKL
jgi:transaldolase